MEQCGSVGRRDDSESRIVRPRSEVAVQRKRIAQETAQRGPDRSTAGGTDEAYGTPARAATKMATRSEHDDYDDYADDDDDDHRQEMANATRHQDIFAM